MFKNLKKTIVLIAVAVALVIFFFPKRANEIIMGPSKNCLCLGIPMNGGRICFGVPVLCEWNKGVLPPDFIK